MADYLRFTTCNGATVREPEEVQKILDSYAAYPEITLESDRTFSWGDETDWPEAWKLPAGVARNEFDPYDMDLGDEGEDGFIQLLREIAPFLEEPLIVQAIGYHPLRYPLSAAAWKVEPGSTTVTINRLQFE